MRVDRLYERFGTPDYAFALHVSASIAAGVVNVLAGSPFAGADTVDRHGR